MQRQEIFSASSGGAGNSPDAAAKRLAVLQLAEKLGNAAEACRRSGMDRSSFFAWRRRFRESGLAGLKDRPPVVRRHPQTTPKNTADLIGELALAEPGLGCDRISELVASRHGERVSAVTVQKILNRSGLGRETDRWLALEAIGLKDPGRLSPKQLKFVRARNPLFGLDRAATLPGQTLCCFIEPLRRQAWRPRLYVHGVVDASSFYAFAVLSPSPDPMILIGLLDGEALPFYARLGARTETAVTGQSWFRYHARDVSPASFEVYLACRGIRPVRERGSWVVCQRFLETARREFKRGRGAGTSSIQSRFKAWLADYNWRRADRGRPARGLTPAAAIGLHPHLDGKVERAAAGEALLPPTFLQEGALAQELASIEHSWVEEMRIRKHLLLKKRNWDPSCDIGNWDEVAVPQVVFEHKLAELNKVRSSRGAQPVTFAEDEDPSFFGAFKRFALTPVPRFGKMGQAPDESWNWQAWLEPGMTCPASRPSATETSSIPPAVCGAQTRKGVPCQSAPVRGRKRCRMHGGAWGSGAPKGNQNARKHGRFSRTKPLRPLPVEPAGNRTPEAGQSARRASDGAAGQHGG